MTQNKNHYGAHIQQSHQQNVRAAEWAKLKIVLLIFLLIATFSGAVFWYYYYGFVQTIDIIVLLLGGVVILACTIACSISNTLSISKLQQRNCAEDLLHFDLYQSNKEALAKILIEANQHFDRGRRRIDNLATLLAEAKQVSERFARLQSELDSMHKDMRTADKLNELFRLRQKEQDINDVNDKVVSFLDRLAPLEQ